MFEGEPAPPIFPSGVWINSKPLTLEDLRGKVVLLDFWTYSCVNCIRTLPWLKSWYEKYKGKGFEIIGSHSPEFEFEKDAKNVKAAIAKLGVTWPVFQDNQRRTMTSYENPYWPRKFLLDRRGIVRYDHIGEGGYEETERKLVELLSEKLTPKEKGDLELLRAKKVSGEVPEGLTTPELYAGFAFRRSLGNPEGLKPDQTVDYKPVINPPPHLIFVKGRWHCSSDHMRYEGAEGGNILLRYFAKVCNVVLGPGKGKVRLSLFLDGKPLPKEAAGRDAQFDSKGAFMMVDEPRMYNPVRTKSYESHELRMEMDGPGLQLYAFTFG